MIESTTQPMMATSTHPMIASETLSRVDSSSTKRLPSLFIRMPPCTKMAQAREKTWIHASSVRVSLVCTHCCSCAAEPHLPKPSVTRLLASHDKLAVSTQDSCNSKPLHQLVQGLLKRNRRYDTGTYSMTTLRLRRCCVASHSPSLLLPYNHTPLLKLNE